MKKNILFAVAVLVVAGVLALWGAQRGAGAQAVVSVADGQTQRIPLSQDGLYSIEGAPFPVTLEVKEGAIRFVDSQCPDHICENFGWLSKEYDQAICAPAGVVVSIEEG
ncbi:NusG domain II-containing protein [uncultured Ruthenibacterium sp.]|uniref:NusG domain II-containing protein n=1 Tax=uncultured Ruthenibacterium sp. TaxID=1905347 RepID=UPI00349E71A3